MILRECDIPKRTSSTRYEYYKFFVMSFGLTNVPATFIDLMNKKFKSYLDLCFIVIDVILVYLRNEKDDSSDLRFCSAYFER